MRFSYFVSTVTPLGKLCLRPLLLTAMPIILLAFLLASLRQFAAAEPPSFPMTEVLDDFDRADGPIGGNWSGDTTDYAIVDNQLEYTGSGEDIYWNNTAFAVDQEAYVTLQTIDLGGEEIGLVLKSQSSTGYDAGLLVIAYYIDLEQVMVWSFLSGDGWISYGAAISVTFDAGDQFGVRALADGQVEVYKNGTLLGSRDVSTWPYYNQGGYIGLFPYEPGTVVFDDFGGGTLNPIPFPITEVLDDFNRADGPIGGNWSGNTTGYAIVDNELEYTGSAEDIYWNSTAFAADQEAYITLQAIDLEGEEIGLVLKSQSSTGYDSGLLNIVYNPDLEQVIVWSFSGSGWTSYGAAISVTFDPGDQFGVRALINGQVEVYKNGTLLGSRDVSTWPYYNLGGYIGLFPYEPGTVVFDDFGGGALNPIPFPITEVLDDFNRADGAIGGNWSGSTTGYAIADNQLEHIGSGEEDIYWNSTAFAADQEAYITLQAIDLEGEEVGLVLKSQSSTDYDSGQLQIVYIPYLEMVAVRSYLEKTGWVSYGKPILITFEPDDQFGVRAMANGQVEIYKNGALVGTRHVSSWPYYDQGGYIGLVGYEAGEAILDDFGGGSVDTSPPPTPTSTPTPTAAPTSTPTPTATPSLRADFTADPVIGHAPLAVSFYDNSVGSITSYLWNFGDGSSSVLASPVHTYTESGIYAVSLAVTDASSQHTLTRTNYIFVNPPVVSLPNQAPVITITNPSLGSVTGSTLVQVSGEVTDDGTVQSVEVNGVAAIVDGDTFSATITVAGGNQTINAVAEDDEGALGFDSTVIRVDDEGPIIDIIAPLDRQAVYTLNPTVTVAYRDFLSAVATNTLSVALTDENSMTDDVTGDLVVEADSASGILSIALSQDTSYTLTVTLEDEHGNGRVATSRFYVPISPTTITPPAEPVGAAWASGVVYDSSTCNEYLTTCQGVAGVQVTAAEINPESRVVTPTVGTIVSGPDGFFAFPFDKTGFFTLRFEKDGFTYGQREIAVVRERSTAINEIYLTPLDTAVTPCDNDGCNHTNSDGSMQIDIPAGAIPAGQSVDVRATVFDHVEFLPGGDLPPNTWETYAFNLSGDSEMEFLQPVTVRLTNTLGFAPGTSIPLGYWDQEALQWQHEGVGIIDETGEWLVMHVTHFSNYDCNLPVWFNLAVLQADIFDWTRPDEDCSDGEAGCMITAKSGQLREWIQPPAVNILGESLSPQLSYSTIRANPSEVIDLELDLWYDPELIDVAEYLYFELYVEGEKTDTFTFQADPDEDGNIGRFRYLWDGRNALGQLLPPGIYEYAVRVRIPYTAEYYWSTITQFGQRRVTPTGITTEGTRSVWLHGTVELNTQIDTSLGNGWVLDGHQQLSDDEAGRILVTEGDTITEYYNVLADDLYGRRQYNLPQPRVKGAAASVIIAPTAVGTHVNGTITSNTAWTANNSPYILDDGNVTVADGVTLTIEPGVQVMLDQDLSLFVQGAISATGTATSPITFTAYSDGFYEDWTTYPITNTELSGLMIVEAAATDAVGNAWFGGFVGGYGGSVGVTRLNTDLELDSFAVPTYFSSASAIYGTGVDGAGQKWFVSDRGVIRLSADNTTWTEFTESNSDLLSDYVYAVAVDASNGLWFGTDSGVSHRAANNTWTSYTEANSDLASDQVTSIAVAENGDIWIGTGDAGLSMFDGSSWTTYNTGNSDILGNSVLDIVEDAEGNIWLAIANSGISVLQTDTNWVNYTANNSDLVSNFVTTVAVDIRNRKWVGYQNSGVSMVSADNQVWLHETYPTLPDNYVLDMAASPNGDVWVATSTAAGVSRYHEVAYYDGAISGGYWGQVKIGGGANMSDSDGSLLRYVTFESGGVGGQSLVSIDSSTMTLENVRIGGSGGDGLTIEDSNNVIMNQVISEANEGTGIKVAGGAGGHILTEVQSWDNKGHGLSLAHSGRITMTNATIGGNDGYAIFTTNTTADLTLQSSSIHGNYQPARLSANSLLIDNEWFDNDSNRIEWTGGTITTDRTWSPDWDAHILLGSITVGDGVTLTIEPGTTVLLGSGHSLIVHGNLAAVGTFENSIYFARASNSSWNYVQIGGGADGDSDNSILRYVIAQGGARGLYLYRSTPSLEYLSFINNSYGLYVQDSDDVIIRNSNFARNTLYGLYNADPGQVVTATHNYWGSPAGPNYTGHPSDGQSVSSGVTVDPWRGPILMDGLRPFTAGRTETDYSTVAFDEDTQRYVRLYSSGREVYFDDQGRHDYTIYPDGRVLSYTYHMDGSIATMNIRAPGESTPHWTWDFVYTEGKLDSITDPAGRATNFTVDDNGQLTAVVYPDGSTEDFFYNANNLLTQHSDRNGDITGYGYDGYGRVLTDTRPIRTIYDPDTGQTESGAETRLFAPSDTAFPLINAGPVGDPLTPAPAVPTSTQLVDTITYGRGSVTGLTNQWGNWLEKSDATGRTTTYERDSANNVYGLELNGGDCLRANYDSRGNPVSVARIDGTECDQFNPTNKQEAGYSYEERFNKIKTTTDAYGRTTTYVYDYEEEVGESGYLIRIEYPVITDENGLPVTPTLSYTYNAFGFVETKTDAHGAVTRYVYTQGIPDEAANGATPLFAPGVSPVPGLLTTIIENDGVLTPTEVLTTTYKDIDALGNPLTVIAPGGLNITRFLYDDMGRVISQTNAVGITTLSEYNPAGNLVHRVTDYTPDGTTGRNIVTTFIHDADGRLLQEYTVADGVVAQTSYEYDINGNLAAQTDARGHTTRFRYDDANRLINVIDPTGTTMTYTHDLNGRVATLTDADGFVSRTEYDALGRVSAQIRDEGGLNLTTSYTYDLNNNVATMTAPDGTVTCYEYDALNRQTAQVQACGPGGLSLRTETAYDVNGNPVYTVDERGTIIYNEYDALNRLTLTRQDDGGLDLETIYTYDTAGNLATITDVRGIVSVTSYDEKNRPVSHCADENGLNLCSTYTYDRLDNQESVTDANGVVQFSTYNAFGMPLTVIADYGLTGLNATTSYQYDTALNLIRYTNDNNNSTIYIYTPRNEVQRESYADGTTIDYTYDGRGNIATRTDQADETVTYTYDGVGRNTSVLFSGGSQSYQYDPMGRTTLAEETANGHHSLLTYGYNALGDVISTTQELDGVGGGAWQVDYSYDYLTGVYTVTYPSGVAAVYSLDPMGRLDAVQQANGSLLPVAAYTYDDLNSFFEITYGNDAVSRFEYDALRRTTAVQLTVDTTTLADYGYGYDNAGNRTTMQRHHVSGSPADVYAYDNLYQLTQAWYGADGLTPGAITAYDDLQTYTLDTLGNRLEVENDDGSQVTVTPYGPHNNQQLTNGMNRYEAVADNPLAYDLRGNTLADGLTANSYDYDLLSRQVAVSNATYDAEYIYDAMGRRIAKVITTTAGVTTTYFLYDKQFRIIEERSDENTWAARYTYGSGIDELLLLERDSSRYYLHRDALGSITEVTDESGGLVERYEYDVYGEPFFFDGSYDPLSESAIGNPYLFTGRQYDPESGNYYYRARLYSPALGRFLSTDPLGYAAGDANLYRYVFNNPANLTDPTGEIVPLVAALLLVAKAIDYGLTAYDIWQATEVIKDPCATPEDILFATLNLALAVVFELIEPDDLLPIGVPADDVARRAIMREARRAFDDEGIEGMVRVIKEKTGDNANDILRQMGLEDYIDDVVGAICSFSGDTLVSTIDGLEAISTIEEGDWVLAYDEATGIIGYYPVLATWVHEDPVIVLLTIDGETIETTPEHPFRTANGDWVTAGNLRVGDWLQKADGTSGKIDQIHIITRPQLMYDLTVGAAHTFFVGEMQWLVHNCKAYASTANMALRQLPEDLRGATVAMSMDANGKPILAVFGRTREITEEAIQYLRNKGWNVLDAPVEQTPAFHAERQLYNAGYTKIGISRQQGMCPSCIEFFSDKPHVTVTEYGPP